LSKNAAASLVDADPGNFSKMLQGKRGPGRSLAARIKQEWGTEIEWWDEQVELPPADPEAT